MPEPAALHVRCNASVGSLSLSVDFTTAAAWTVLFGPSGSGKSSLLRLIAGLWQAPDARIGLGHEDITRIPAYLRRIGYVAQEPALFPHLDVIGNLLFGCAEKERADAMLHLFHLSDLRRARISRLSGGERQRVALARALATAPRLLLLDEVFTGMHLQLRDDLLARVRRHCLQHAIPVVSVTHDPIEATLIDGEVLRLEGGHILSRGTALDTLAGDRQALLRVLARH